MANPFERCPAKYEGTQCERWGGHAGRHRGFNERDMVCAWGDEHVPWNQDDTEVPEDRSPEPDMNPERRIERLQAQLAEAFNREDEYKRQAQGQAEALLHAERARDTEAKNVMTLMGQLEDAMDRLRRIRNLTNGVPDEDPLDRFLRTRQEHRADA